MTYCLEDRIKNTEVSNIELLLNKNLTIPSYQRPYSWEDEQVTQLVEDLIEAWKEEKKIYLVGNLILQKSEKESPKEESLEIVDGQQRITTFALIEYALTGEFKAKFLTQSHFTPLSTEKIRRNHHLIKNRLEKSDVSKKKFQEFFKNRVCVTCTYADTLDEAFFYFDSQNTRGKPLARKDLLKVHHLRTMMDENEEETIKGIVKNWEHDEKVEDPKEVKYLGDDFLEFLFEQLLALARRSVRGELVEEDLTWMDVYREFRSEGGGDLLNNYNQPPLFERYEYDVQRDVVSYMPKIAPFAGPYMLNEGRKYLPFEVTQSIRGGLYFFLYAFKYSKQLKKLRDDPWFRLLDDVPGAGNHYLRKVYRASLLYFYDKFGKRDFQEFAALFFLTLSYYRFNKGKLYKQGVVKFEWNDMDGGEETKQWDPFKVISLKYASEHVVGDLRNYLIFYCDPKKWKKDSDSKTKNDFYDASSRESIDGAFLKQMEREIWGV
ncbi:DUF262 domain-containing protein [Hydrogenimonas cancrithermarum]|nr:DUF262 domain-containing protein [Hydrogenimonas cancrithermarum]